MVAELVDLLAIFGGRSMFPKLGCARFSVLAVLKYARMKKSLKRSTSIFFRRVIGDVYAS
jgi:hypothetical protein